MSAEETPQATVTKPRTLVEDRVEQIATYWGRALVDAVRLVFSKEGNR